VQTSQPFLRLFGVPTLRLASGQDHVFVADRPHQLLALLACRSGWMARMELAEWLWSDRPPAAALSNLRKVLLRAQRVVEGSGAPAIEIRPGLLRWAPASDLRHFELACDEHRAGDALKHGGQTLLQAMDAELSEAALEWLDFERARLAARWRAQAAARLAQLQAQPADAAELAAQLLAADPCDEAALEALVHARIHLGQAAIALRELQEHEQRVRTQFAVEPSARLRSLGEQARRAAGLTPPAGAAPPPASPASAAPAAPAAPAESSSLAPDIVGRRLELMQLRDWIVRERRQVISITGPGGVGKTRLARALLRQLADDGLTSACWVGLADLDSAAALPLRLASALQMAATGAAGADGWSPIVAHLRKGPALLVLDNGEQVEGLAGAIAALLHACPSLQLLNVSRTRLQLEGEWLFPLDGLPLPDADESDPGLLRRNDAVALFEQHARARSPAFELAPQAAAVVRFLHAVEGLPLAIELGAALARLLPVAQIEAEIAGAARQAPALDASFELSWRQLSPVEQQALHALACLPADVDRAWAEQVARAPLPVLSSLVDKSLLRADGSGRFGLHPLLRRWASARLCDAAIRAGVDERHAAVVAHALEQLGRQGSSAPEQLVGTLRTEWSHVDAAWRRGVTAGDAGFVARVTPVLQRFFELHGGWSEGLEMFSAALLSFADAQPGMAARARMQLLRALAALQVRCGRYEDAEAHARQALRMALRGGDGPLAEASLTTLGLSVFSRGLYARARPIFEQAVRRSRALGDPVRLDVALGNLAVTELALGRFEAALNIFGELITRSRARGETGGLIVYLGNAGEAHRGRGDWPAALAANQEALALCDRYGVRSRRVTKLLNLATVQHALGRLDAAEAGLGEALAEARSTGDRSNEAASLLARAALRIDHGDAHGPRADLAAALDIALSMDSADLQVRCALVFGEWQQASGAAETGRGWLQWALSQSPLYAVERAMALHRLARRGAASSEFAGSARSPGFEVPPSPRDAALRLSAMATLR
jgi:tetratricopeptide (TPR) repeat protein/DNA-binding SARP family transcriptional activator